jgi:hypothetical protein
MPRPWSTLFYDPTKQRLPGITNRVMNLIPDYFSLQMIHGADDEGVRRKS